MSTEVLSVSKYAKEVTPRRPTNKVVRTHDHRRRIRLPIDRFPWLKHAEIASELFDIISQGWDMRPQVNNVEITKKLAGDRIVSRELKLLPFRQSGFDTSDQLADRHRRFCARCVRHVRFMASSCPLTLYRGTAKSHYVYSSRPAI